VKVKVKVGFLYSATYTVNHRDQPRFTISEVVVDWQEPMVLQRKLRLSIARVIGQLDPRHAASKHTTAPINHTRPSHFKHSPDVATRARKQTSDYSLLLIYRPRKVERLSWPSWLTCSGWFTHISTGSHPSPAGRAQDRESSLCHTMLWYVNPICE